MWGGGGGGGLLGCFCIFEGGWGGVCMIIYWLYVCLFAAGSTKVS